MTSIRDQLKEHLENGDNWEKMETPIQGVYIVKVPKTKTRKAMLYLEINPLNDNGKPLKRKGLFINSKEMLLSFTEALNNEKSFLLISIIDQINRKGVFDLNEYKEIINTQREDLKDKTGEETEEQEIDEKIIPEKELETEFDMGQDKDIESEEEMEVISEKEPEKGERIYVDIANILYIDRDGHGKLKVKNIPKIIETLKLHGYRPILIADASIKHDVDDKKNYERMVIEKIVREAPAGRTADIFILKQAKKKDCKFLTNDLYRDYYGKFDKNWIFSHRLTCMFEDGEIIID